MMAPLAFFPSINALAAWQEAVTKMMIDRFGCKGGREGHDCGRSGLAEARD
jgi:hypothetical protein